MSEDRRSPQELRAATANEIPNGQSRLQPFGAELRSETVIWEGSEKVKLTGTASVVEKRYRMWDMFGEYDEVVDQRAFNDTLSNKPDVAFLVNHRGVTMARTTNNTLVLASDSQGLQTEAYVNPKRTDVKDLLLAIEDRDVTEMSFAFRIEDGSWNDDYTEFRILKVDLDRGDVSAVNYGANPYTSIAARQREVLADLQHLPPGAKRAAAELLRDQDVTEEAPAEEASPEEERDEAASVGRSVKFIQALLET